MSDVPTNDLNLLPTGPAPESTATLTHADAPAVIADGAPTDAPAEDKPAESSPDVEAKKALRGVQQRINELTRKTAQAEETGRQNTEYWRNQAIAAAQALEASKKAEQPPRFEQFQGNMDEYTAAVAAHVAQKIADERTAQERQYYATNQHAAAQAAAAQQAEVNYVRLVETKITEAVKKYPDFVDVVTSPELPAIRNTPAFSAILDSDKGAEIMYYLGKNPLRAHQIASLSPIGQVREIGMIEASIKAGTTVSSAPPPVGTVAGNAAGPKESGSMSYKQFVDMRRRQIAQRR